MDGVREPVTVVVVGAGHRGGMYAQYSQQHPEQMTVVGVAEPQAPVRQAFQKKYDIPEERCFVDWQSLAREKRIADSVFIGTQDEDHVHSATALAAKGYHILLEKPMATTAKDCHAIYRACQEAGIILAVCHVLRYFPPVQKLKELIDAGVIGEVTNINHTEPVGFWHFAHSFVRGNWNREERSAFSLLTKSCHDVDLIAYWMSNTSRCTKVSSFGSLQHFRKDKKPKGAAKRCLDCKIERTCPYSARRIYLDPEPLVPRWPMSAVCALKEPEVDYVEQLENALRKGPYGKCVYDTDNDVCDNQVVNFEFENGATATLTMVAHSELVCARQTTIYGSHGQLFWNGSMSTPVRQFDFLTQKVTHHDCQSINSGGWGHGGADYFLVKSFISAVTTGSEKLVISGPEISLQTHLLCFAAEHSRRTGRVVDVTKESQWSVHGQGEEC